MCDHDPLERLMVPHGGLADVRVTIQQDVAPGLQYILAPTRNGYRTTGKELSRRPAGGGQPPRSLAAGWHGGQIAKALAAGHQAAAAFQSTIAIQRKCRCYFIVATSHSAICGKKYKR
jgi:hypothetical protein